MIVLMAIGWLVVVFGAYAMGRLRGLRQAIEIIIEEHDTATGQEDYMHVPLRVAKRLSEKSQQWSPWSLWR